MKLFSSSAMRELDGKTIEQIGVPGIVLMENASRGVFEIIHAEMGPLKGLKGVIVCGKGNNGGDGFAVARHLFNAGAQPKIVLAADPKEIAGDAKINMFICKNLSIPIHSAVDFKRLGTLRKLVREADFVVDALLGTGVSGPLKPLFLNIINIVNSSDCPIFAVDIPSGVQADDGRVFNGAVNADHTITFGAPKIGLYVYPGAGFAGNINVVDIGIPGALTDKAKTDVFLATKAYVGTKVKERAAAAHKGDCGRLLIIGGSRGMSGAPCLAGTASLRTGAGLVYLAVPKGMLSVVEHKLTEGITIPQPEDRRGRISLSGVKELIEQTRKVDAVVLGPGIGVSDETCELVCRLIEESRTPMLVDADALNCIAREREVLKSAKAPLVLTPHPGEMARLAKMKTADVQTARLDTVRSFAREFRAVVVLKGAHTLIASPSGIVYVNPTGNSGMATAGSGDVLSGIGGALLAEGVPAFDAAVCAAYLHGLSGDKAADRFAKRSIMASDIIRYIPAAINEIMYREN